MIKSREVPISENAIHYLITLVGISFIVTACFSVIYFVDQNEQLFFLTMVVGSAYLATLILFIQKQTTLAVHFTAFIASSAVLYASLITSDVIVWIPATALMLFLTLNHSATIWTKYIFIGTVVVLIIDHNNIAPLYHSTEAINIIFALSAVFIISRLFLKRLDQQQQEIIQQSQTIAQEQALIKQAEAEKQISSGVAHLINNEMQAINNYAFLLQQKITEPQQLEMLDSIYQLSLKAGDHATQLLHYSNNSNIELNATDIRKSILDWHQQNDSSPDSTKLLLNLGDSPVICPANAATFHNVIHELWKNAVEACDRNGTIVITLKTTAEQAIIQVIDNGHGMSGETLNNVFKPFYSTRFTGRGLGLASIKGIMEAHHGTIHIESREGYGTKVTLTLLLSN